ncbi:general stress protein [Paenibacillus sp. YPG26]|uniref:general stress protein n=1 Tax=Paenibacillus sp. YPG26 TaxID=2878915 RepID=UPI00203C6ADF|nr:general stress protein [Paenibacillus sp. YPG26]USB33734.1 general stress protein [Paenibacillus sp. YPG26]
MTEKIVGVFQTEDEATGAIQELKDQGIPAEDISIIAKDRRHLNSINEETGTKSPEGIAAGATAGGVLGGVTGLLAGLGALAVPGVGPILAAGPIAAALTGAALGAGAGGLAGGLVGLGVPEEQARVYDTRVNEGRILVLIDAEPYQMNGIYQAFRDHNSLNAHYYSNNNSSDRTEEQEVVGTHESRKDEENMPWYNEKDVPPDPEAVVSNAENKERELHELHEEQVRKHR